MNMIQKREAIKAGLRKGFRDGSSKMANRKCYGYEICSDGGLAVKPEEATVAGWIFERHQAGAASENDQHRCGSNRKRWSHDLTNKMV